MEPDKFLVLIDAIYAAAADPSLWPSVALKIQHAIGGHSVNLIVEDRLDERVNAIYSNGASQDQIERYQQEIREQDRFTAIYDTMSPGTAVVTQDHFDQGSLQSLYCYEAFYKDIGFANFNAGLFFNDDRRRGWLSVVRSETDRVYTRAECLLMQRLTPHLQRAFQINLQLLEAQLSSKVALDALEHVAAATVLLSSKERVVQHNSRAEPYLAPLGHSTNTLGLHLPCPNANQQLQALIKTVIQGGPIAHDGVTPFIENGRHKTVLCFPWRNSSAQFDWLDESACCIVFILSPTDGPPKQEILQQTFGLSLSEVRVLHQLLGGRQVAEIAIELHVTEATVRFHIKNLLRKTGSRNQADMIARVLQTVSVNIE